MIRGPGVVQLEDGGEAEWVQNSANYESYRSGFDEWQEWATAAYTAAFPWLTQIPGTPASWISGPGLVAMLIALEFGLDEFLGPKETLEEILTGSRAFAAAAAPDYDDWVDDQVDPKPGELPDAANDDVYSSGHSDEYRQFFKEDYVWSETIPPGGPPSDESINNLFLAVAAQQMDGALTTDGNLYHWDPSPPPVEITMPTWPGFSVAPEVSAPGQMSWNFYIAPPQIHWAPETPSPPAVSPNQTRVAAYATQLALGAYYQAYENVDALPAVEVSVAPITGARTGIRVNVQVRPQTKAAEAAEHLLMRDSKMAHQLAYMGLLVFVNKTWGPISEALDFAEVLMASITIDGQKMNKQWLSDFLDDPQNALDELFDLWRAGKVELDPQALMVGLMAETITDLSIAMLSDMEKRAMLALFGQGHLINNMLGMPSTWARRLGIDVMGPLVKPISQTLRQ